MDFEIPINFKNLDFNIMTIVFGIYIAVIGIAYYFIFRKHHKKNKVKLDELITLVVSFYTLTMISTIAIAIGIACILNANTFKYDRTQVVSWVFIGIAIIAITIINYVFYIKRNLADMETSEREAKRKNTIRIGEILELIFFAIFILMPIWRIPAFIEVIDDKKELIKELARSFGLCIAALLLLNALNPTDIKGKIKDLFSKKEKKIK